MEYSPPPLFKQGASARAKVVFFSLLAIALLVVDSRLQSLAMVRQAVGTVLYPLQRIALLPRDAAYSMSTYFSSLSRLEHENRQFRERRVADAQTLQQVQLLASENAQLRRLLGAAQQLPVKSLMAEILYDARDPFTRKIVLDRGSQQGVAAGQPVIDDAGVVGQITRVFPFTAEATLLTDKDQAIPVQVLRSGLRSVAYGRGQSGVLDLRFMALTADIQKGDVLVTSGIDGVYPAGLTVATVAQVEQKSSDMFAKILCLPAAGINRHKQLLILLAETKLPPSLALEEAVKDKGQLKKPGPAPKDTKEAKEAVQEATPVPARAAPVKPAVPSVPQRSVAPAGGPVPSPAKPAVQAPTLKPASPAETAGDAAGKPPLAARSAAPLKPVEVKQ